MRAGLVAATVLALTAVAPVRGRVSEAADARAPLTPPVEDGALRPVMTRRYVMSGKVRPLRSRGSMVPVRRGSGVRTGSRQRPTAAQSSSR